MHRSAFSLLSACMLTLGSLAEAAPQLFASQNTRCPSTPLGFPGHPGNPFLLAISLPLQAASSWIQGWLAIAFGGLMKQRLLAGSLAIDVDKIRTQGVGELLSRVLESEAVENLALGGGTQTILAILELAVAAYVLTLGAAPLLCLSPLQLLDDPGHHLGSDCDRCLYDHAPEGGPRVPVDQ